MLRKRLQAGDTIVEVMVALAVLSLAISICYATANRSLMNERQAQESNDAATVLQSQLELLRSVGGNSSAKMYNSGTTFCIQQSNPTDNGIISTDALHPCPWGLYNTLITYVPTDGIVTHGGTFTLTATWTDALGQGQDGATLNYEVYPND